MTTKKSTTKAKSNGRSKDAYPPFTPALVDRVLKMHDNGLSKATIAEAIGGGYPVHRVWKILALAGRTKNSPALKKRAAAGGVGDVVTVGAKKSTVKKARAKASASV